MIILAAILLAMGLIALIPVGVFLQYGDSSLLVRAVLGPVRLTLYPRRPAGDRRKARKLRRLQKKRDKLRRKQESRKTDLPVVRKKLSLSELYSLAKPLLELLGQMRRKLLVRELTVQVSFGGPDAARTAICYGRAWALIGAVTPLLENAFRIQNRKIDAVLGSTEDTIQLFLRMEIRMRIGTGFFLALKAGFRVLKTIMQKKKKAVQANGTSSL